MNREARAELMRLGMLELQFARGRLAKVTNDDVAHLLELVDVADGDRSIGAAWLEVMAVLPDGWDLMLMSTIRHGSPGCWAATASEPRDPETGAYSIVSTTASRRPPDPDPSSALRALAAALVAHLARP